MSLRVSAVVGEKVSVLGTLSRIVAFEQSLGGPWLEQTLAGKGECVPGKGNHCPKAWKEERGSEMMERPHATEAARPGQRSKETLQRQGRAGAGHR